MWQEYPIYGDSLNSFFRNKAWILAFMFILFAKPETYSQKSFGGTPESFALGIKSAPPELSMPQFSMDSLLKADSIEILHGRKTYRFAKAFEVDYTPLNSGEWMETEKGSRIWRLSIYSKNAYSIGILLKNYQPIDGARIFIYNPEHTEILGAFTSENITPGGYLTIYPIPSDHAIVEYDMPAGAIAKDGFTIGMVAHDYKNAFGKNSTSSSAIAVSGSCNVDINCPAGANWQSEKRAVVKLRINMTDLCTGILVNNIRKDGKAYLLTANHCVYSASAAYNTLAIFNYEKDICGGIATSANQSISGTWLRATTPKIDFSLVELGEKPPLSFSPYYAGWSIDTLGISNGTAIHHPQGDVKKISYSNSSPVTDDFGNGYEFRSHWRVNQWSIGTTEPGSSGCPLFDQNHYIVGTLTGGYAKCPYDSSRNDYFQKISRAWADFPDSTRQLKFWLDPDNTKARNLQGMNPYSYTVGNCSVKTNILNSDSVINPVIPGYTGSYAGHNGLGIALYADRFIAIDTIKLTALIFNIASLIAAGSNSFIIVHIWKGNNQPETLIYSQNVLYKSLTNTIKNSITLDKVIALKDTFFVGFEISYASTDKFALFIAPDRFTASLNTSYAFVGGVWTSFSEIMEYVNLSTSMDIGLQTCDMMTSINSNRTPGDEISIYPNPTTGLFRIISNDPGPTGAVSIYDMRGRLIKYSLKTHSSDGVEINLSEAAPGIYIVRGQSRQGPWTKKLLKF